MSDESPSVRRPVTHNRLTDNSVFGDWPEHARIAAVVTVIAHKEVFVLSQIPVAPVAIGGETWDFHVSGELRGNSPHDVVIGHFPLAVLVHRHADTPAFVKYRSTPRILVTPILPPIGAALIPGEPDAILFVYGDGSMRLEQR